jgi:hypothetical protein
VDVALFVSVEMLMTRDLFVGFAGLRKVGHATQPQWLCGLTYDFGRCVASLGRWWSLCFSHQDVPSGVDLNGRGVPEELVLDSGRVIPIIGLPHDAERRHLELEYVTEFRILEDHQALQYEAEDIWAEFLERQANALNVTVVHLSPRDSSPPVSMISFRVSRGDTGEWCKEGGFAFPFKRSR